KRLVGAQCQSDRQRYRRRNGRQYLPLRYLRTHTRRHQVSRWAAHCTGGGGIMNSLQDFPMKTSIQEPFGLSRRHFLKASAAVGGGLLISFSLPMLVRDVQASTGAGFQPNAYVR